MNTIGPLILCLKRLPNTIRGDNHRILLDGIARLSRWQYVTCFRDMK